MRYSVCRFDYDATNPQVVAILNEHSTEHASRLIAVVPTGHGELIAIFEQAEALGGLEPHD